MIPQSLRRSLESQELPALREIMDLVERLILERSNASDQPSGRGKVLEVERSGSMTYRLEMVSCGKNCKGCPHGPYWYGYWREGGKTRSRYIGKSLRRT